MSLLLASTWYLPSGYLLLVLDKLSYSSGMTHNLSHSRGWPWTPEPLSCCLPSPGIVGLCHHTQLSCKSLNFIFIWLLDRVYTAAAGLELIVQTRSALTLKQSFRVCLLSVGITDALDHTHLSLQVLTMLSLRLLTSGSLHLLLLLCGVSFLPHAHTDFPSPFILLAEPSLLSRI